MKVVPSSAPEGTASGAIAIGMLRALPPDALAGKLGADGGIAA